SFNKVSREIILR
ncbi:putative serine/threonine kinase domain protein, partial [Chlamydia psittaci 84-8471/1]